MKGALILSRDREFFNRFSELVKKSNFKYLIADQSIRILSDDMSYIMIYDMVKEDDALSEYEIPIEARVSGYGYAFLAECRSEVFFCEVMGSEALKIDILICDGDGKIYRPEEISPEKIVL